MLAWPAPMPSREPFVPPLHSRHQRCSATEKKNTVMLLGHIMAMFDWPFARRVVGKKIVLNVN